MRTSESIKELAGALVKAQMAIEAVKKDKVGRIQGKDGKQGYEYKYSDLASVIEHIKQPLNDNGLVFIQSPERADGGIIVATRIMHVSGEWVEGETYVPVPFATAQAFGSAISYGKRYGLQAMTGLPSEDDDGKKATDDDGMAPMNKGAASPASPPAPKASKLTPAQFQEHANAIGNAATTEALHAAYVKAYRAADAAGDKQAVSRFTDLKDERKESLAPALASQP